MNHDCTCFSGRTTVDVGDKGRPCLVHPYCACGCPRMAHANEGIGECKNGLKVDVPSPKCHGCPEYRPAKLRAYAELDDATLDNIGRASGQVPVAVLLAAYRELRAHHIEETTVLHARALAFPANASQPLNTEDVANGHYVRMLQLRSIELDDVCKICMGYGTRRYSNTSTWRGGMGGASITTGICDQCWGSGDRVHEWLNLRSLREDNAEAVARDAVDALARSCGAGMASTGKSVRQIITHLEALQRKRKIGNDPVDFWMLPLANGLANLLRRAIGEPEWDWNRDKPMVMK